MVLIIENSTKIRDSNYNASPVNIYNSQVTNRKHFDDFIEKEGPLSVIRRFT